MKIDLAALRYNAHQIIRKSKTPLCAVVKCNAYGHGDVECAKTLLDSTDCFAVADKNEAWHLYRGGIKKDILILSDIYDGKAYPDNFIFCAFDSNTLKYLRLSGRRFIIKINTGMNRLGLSLSEFLAAIGDVDIGRIHSIYTHIYDKSSIDKQYCRFMSIVRNLPTKKHIFASNFCNSHMEKLDFVRCGLALYGYGFDGLKPVMSVFSTVKQVRLVRKGENIGYGINAASHDCLVAVVDAGYGDGLRRIQSSKERFVYLNGRKCCVVGQVCMDQCIVEASSETRCGDKVEIMGNNILAESIAGEWGTSIYEVLIAFDRDRVVRNYSF